MRTRKIDAGDLIFSEGEPADAAFLIEEGTVEISVGPDGGGQTLAMLGPGEVFGEMGVIDGSPRSATATAIGNCLLVEVSAEQIQQVIAKSDPFFAELMRKLVGRLRDTQASLIAGDDIVALRSSDLGAGYNELVVERNIAEAIISGEIEPYLQPIVDLRSGAALGYESLARWRSETMGLMRPFDFLPMARRTGLIRRIDLTMTDRAMTVASHLGDAPDAPFVTVNFSGWLFQDRDLAATLRRMLDQHGLAPSRLCLEVTETALIDDMDAAGRSMTELRNLGVRMALDDFGTGLSSINVLCRQHFDIVKVDGSLVQGCHASSRQRAILQGILDLCRRLDIDVVAEGIEDAETAATLLDLGYATGQGLHFAPPTLARQAMASWREEH
ncbi:EAL domain-containing protein [Magnetospirillum sp. SS-4]|uniref:EAL domain-containing protein n=1 Tax=Magnetospirillum sp. SS-4 TaxID=2681465 RepID=UPI00137D3F8C|nr:EAL domain-containing protein [Magnetospirillum sp. SS-4]CAA7614331.1 Signal transduction protein [Magnetospirillum sp. SS-4]